MADPISPFEKNPPPARQLARGIVAAVVAAALLLVLVVLPAEFGIDATGFGRLTGLDALHASPKGAPMQDVIGGNDNLAAGAGSPGDPIPLPNPAVSQPAGAAPRTHTQTIIIPEFKGTEVKALLDAAQVILYSWEADDDVYVDFHGHDPAVTGDGFVRYDEKQSTRAGHGSLVAPFKGEHGWYWLNIGEKPVTIRLTVTGYFSDIKDYGILDN